MLPLNLLACKFYHLSFFFKLSSYICPKTNLLSQMQETTEDSTAMTLINSKISSIDQNITSIKEILHPTCSPHFLFLFFFFLFSFFISCFLINSLTIFIIVYFIYLFIYFSDIFLLFKKKQFHNKNQQPQSQYLSQSHWLAGMNKMNKKNTPHPPKKSKRKIDSILT